MCGIVGLLVKKAELRDRLGAMMVPMLVGMTERGPDSAGLAVYTAPVGDKQHKLSLYSGAGAVDWPQILKKISADFPRQQTHEITLQGNHAVLTSTADPAALSAWIARHEPGVAVLSVG